MGSLKPGTFSKHEHYGQDEISRTFGMDQMTPWLFWTGPNVLQCVQIYKFFSIISLLYFL